VKLESKKKRAARENFKKAGVWIFLCIFVLSIAGVTLVTVGAR
jgi:hypothetical protein